MSYIILFFFFNDTATTEIYPLSLHDALPIFVAEPVTHANDVFSHPESAWAALGLRLLEPGERFAMSARFDVARSEEHTSELQSRQYLVCRLLLEKKKNYEINSYYLLHQYFIS